MVGLSPVVPTPFLLVILMQLPFAYALWATTLAPPRVPPVVGVLVGVALLLAPAAAGAWPWFASILLFAGHCVWAWRRGCGPRLVGAFALLFVAYAAIWNGNYLALRAVGDRLQDAMSLRLDTILFSSATHVGMYPLVHAPWLIGLLERAYVYAFTEVMAVVLILVANRDALMRFLGTLLISYGLALAIFLCVPVVGPGVVYPESNRLRQPAQTAQIQQFTAREYRAVRAGGQPTNGFGYFVGAPSMHVAIAVLVWLTVRRKYPLAGWALAPVNIMLGAATVVLGHHYVLDAISGLFLPVLSAWFYGEVIRRRNGQGWASAGPVDA